ncbi:MAG: FAD-dependent monooxygenase, partial [Thiotrichales bacterium]|nr:FAD-dependent monooxygenase [Thiotrichales bacterium]
MAMVFTVKTAQADHFLAMPDEKFSVAIQQQFGRRLGRLGHSGKRSSYPITMHQVDDQFKHRVLLLGNSAHTLHPNAAQGFNLALRDVAALCNVLRKADQHGEDPGMVTLLERYMDQRRADQQRVLQLTDRLASTFYTSHPCLTLGRNLGMLATEVLPGLKNWVMRQGAGLNSDYQVAAL